MKGRKKDFNGARHEMEYLNGMTLAYCLIFYRSVYLYFILSL